ncbi:MAG: N-acetylmuramoyl-L-alanine amidase [Deltaproteobacteria bacterium]|nr:N-acetylmuramoyl-L-alanine amidase [Deltaproteobacteria bacterium]
MAAIIFTLGLGWSLFFNLPGSFAAAKVLEIRHWTAPDHTRVVIDLEGSPTYEVPPADDPLLLRIYLSGAELVKGRREIPVNDRVVRQMRVEPRGGAGAELILSLVKPARWNIFVLKPYMDKPDRVVIDVFRPDLEEKEKAARQVIQELKARRKQIVLLDPGHGGEDPGAIGPRGTREKDIVLALGTSLQKELDRSGEIRAFLTRRGDYFVTLDERVKIAKEYGADLLVSLHANGNKQPRVRGTSVYCLSLKGASDQATQTLAQKENASDMVGGASLPQQKADLDSILLDLEMTHTINESLHLGGLALSELQRVNSIQFFQPKQAGFRVLKGSGIPAILIEVAYVTNPTEEKLLRKKSFQKEITQAIYAALKKFLPRLTAREEESGGGKGAESQKGEKLPPQG